MPIPLEQEFHEAMVEIYRRSKQEAKYNATRYIKMVSEHGGVEAAKILINADCPSEGYTELWERGRLDITVEALVVENSRWHSLFEAEEIERARQRLQKYNYRFSIESAKRLAALGGTEKNLSPIPRRRSPSESIDPRIVKMVERIVAKFNPEKVILFGSYARGNPRPDSDVDLLVVIATTGSVRQKANEIDLALLDRKIPLDLIVLTPEQFEIEQKRLGSVVRPALREGKVLYDRAA